MSSLKGNLDTLKDKLEKDMRDKEDLARHVQDALPKLLGTVQVLFRILERYLVDVVTSGYATTSYGKTRLKPEYWETVFFPVLEISISGKSVVEVMPYGPVAGSACRIDISCGSKTYLLLWDGKGNDAANWKIKFGEGPKVESQPLTKTSFDDALAQLIDQEHKGVELGYE